MQIKGLVFKQRQLNIIKKHFGIENKSFDEKKTPTIIKHFTRNAETLA